MRDNNVKRCAQLIRESREIVALTGAGVSTNAGIPDFRGPQGLYVTRRYDPERVFDIQYFRYDPLPFYDFARDFMTLIEHVQPTFTHEFLAHLEKIGKLSGIITQNIDHLHQQAGAKNVIELHGSFYWSLCLSCGKKYTYSQMREKIRQEKVPHCTCRGIIKPDVVFYGEAVRNLEQAYAMSSRADLILVIGTSCAVYPAALIPSAACGKIIVINQQPVAVPGVNDVFDIQDELDSFFRMLSSYF